MSCVNIAIYFVRDMLRDMIICTLRIILQKDSYWKDSDPGLNGLDTVIRSTLISV